MPGAVAMVLVFQHDELGPSEGSGSRHGRNSSSGTGWNERGAWGGHAGIPLLPRSGTVMPQCSEPSVGLCWGSRRSLRSRRHVLRLKVLPTVKYKCRKLKRLTVTKARLRCAYPQGSALFAQVIERKFKAGSSLDHRSTFPWMRRELS